MHETDVAALWDCAPNPTSHTPQGPDSSPRCSVRSCATQPLQRLGATTALQTGALRRNSGGAIPMSLSSAPILGIVGQLRDTVSYR